MESNGQPRTNLAFLKFVQLPPGPVLHSTSPAHNSAAHCSGHDGIIECPEKGPADLNSLLTGPLRIFGWGEEKEEKEAGHLEGADAGTESDLLKNGLNWFAQSWSPVVMTCCSTPLLKPVIFIQASSHLPGILLLHFLQPLFVFFCHLLMVYLSSCWIALISSLPPEKKALFFLFSLYVSTHSVLVEKNQVLI